MRLYNVKQRFGVFLDPSHSPSRRPIDPLPACSPSSHSSPPSLFMSLNTPHVPLVVLRGVSGGGAAASVPVDKLDLVTCIIASL